MRGAFGGRVRAALIVVATTLSACLHASGPFLWVEDVPAARRGSLAAYRIREGDVLGIRVLNQEAMSVAGARVRADGYVSLPVIQDVSVARVTPAEAAGRIGAKLKAYVLNPIVTVTLEEPVGLNVSVLGEVARPGVYDIDGNAGVLRALAAAGGLTPFADREGIYVLRAGYWSSPGSPPARIRFRYQQLARGGEAAAGFRLASGDVVVVE